jgi:hypothetical protein
MEKLSGMRIRRNIAISREEVVAAEFSEGGGRVTHCN